MYREQEYKISNRVQVKFSQYLEKTNNNLSLPEQKFLKNILSGMMKSGSVIVRRSSMTLNEKISLKKTSKRLYHHLKKFGLDEKLRDNLLRYQCRKLTTDSLVLVDPSDIIKPSASKMEDLSKIHDGSLHKNDTNGYDLLNFVGVVSSSEGYRIVPLSGELYSNKLEIDSKSNLIQDRIVDITVYSNNKAIFVFDRGFDSRINIEHLNSNGNNYIIRSKANRGLIVNDRELSFKEVVRSVNLKYDVPTYNNTLQCGIKKVKVRLTPHPKKNPETAETYLVVCKFKYKRNSKTKSKKSEGYFYFLTNFPNMNLEEPEILKKAINAYRLRWKIEELHRQVKQNYGWEEIRLQSYQSLKNMNALLWVMIGFVYSLKEFAFQFAEAFPQLMLDSSKDLERFYDFFIYYRIFQVVKYIFIHKEQYKKVKYKRKSKFKHPELPF